MISRNLILKATMKEILFIKSKKRLNLQYLLPQTLYRMHSMQ